MHQTSIKKSKPIFKTNVGLRISEYGKIYNMLFLIQNKLKHRPLNCNTPNQLHKI
jgi:hypothetical protein